MNGKSRDIGVYEVNAVDGLVCLIELPRLLICLILCMLRKHASWPIGSTHRLTSLARGAFLAPASLAPKSRASGSSFDLGDLRARLMRKSVERPLRALAAIGIPVFAQLLMGARGQEKPAVLAVGAKRGGMGRSSGQKLSCPIGGDSTFSTNKSASLAPPNFALTSAARAARVGRDRPVRPKFSADVATVGNPDNSSTRDRRDEALQFLLGRINYEQSPASPYAQRSMKLDRMRTLLTRLGNPDAGMKIIHVAGTKGKGSTSTYLASILRAAGYEVGVFTSPHLEQIEERFAVNGVPCSMATFADLVCQIRPIVSQFDKDASGANNPGERPTFFEITTAVALLYFAQRQVDAAILEVGLGGRLDATNVCQSIVSIIASISLDHTRQLGDTVEQIAREKAGIIKPGTPVVIGPMSPGPLAEIERIAARHGARTLIADRDFTFQHRAGTLSARAPQTAPQLPQLDFSVLRAQQLPTLAPLELSGFELGLWGRHQAANAALALAAVGELQRQGWLVSTSAMRSGLQGAGLPGRIEVVRQRPLIVLDVAHNPASAEALVRCLSESFVAVRRRLLFAATRDKDVRGMTRLFVPYFDRIVATSYRDNPRGVTAERLAQIVSEELRAIGRSVSDVVLAPDPVAAWQEAREATGDDDLLCIAGSFFLAGELRALVRRTELTLPVVC